MFFWGVFFWPAMNTATANSGGVYTGFCTNWSHGPVFRRNSHASPEPGQPAHRLRHLLRLPCRRSLLAHCLPSPPRLCLLVAHQTRCPAPTAPGCPPQCCQRRRRILDPCLPRLGMAPHRPQGLFQDHAAAGLHRPVHRRLGRRHGLLIGCLVDRRGVAGKSRMRTTRSAHFAI